MTLRKYWRLWLTLIIAGTIQTFIEHTGTCFSGLWKPFPVRLCCSLLERPPCFTTLSSFSPPHPFFSPDAQLLFMLPFSSPSNRMDPLNSTTLDLPLCSTSASLPSNLVLKLNHAPRPMQAVLADICAPLLAGTVFLPVLSGAPLSRCYHYSQLFFFLMNIKVWQNKSPGPVESARLRDLQSDCLPFCLNSRAPTLAEAHTESRLCVKVLPLLSSRILQSCSLIMLCPLEMIFVITILIVGTLPVNDLGALCGV